jgi:oxygen-dependent protoporphyrinogen oxidase
MEKLAEPLDVRLGATVREVIERPGGVEISWTDAEGDHTETGSGAIVSSMGNEVPDLLPQLEPERAAFLRNLRYTSCINVNIGLSREPANMPASFVVFPRPSSDALFAIIAEHNKAPGRAPAGKGLVGLYSMNEWAIEHMDDNDDTIVRSLLREADAVMPGVGDHIEFARVNRWYPVLVYSHPGLYRELGRFHATRRRHGRIHLAGSYNSSGNVNTAVAAGERAARELAAALVAPGGAAPTPPTTATVAG